MTGAAARGGWSWRTYWVSLAVVSALLGLWGLATPPLAVPDEPAHFLKAAAVARGQWIGPPGETTLVRVPPGIAAAHKQPGCFAFKSAVPAGCAPGQTEFGSADVDGRTQAGRYPPAYYAFVGLPTLVWTDLEVLYLVRGMSAALVAALLAAAVTAAAATGRRRLVVATAVTVTPMALFLGAAVNPSGPEIAAAVALWTAGAALVLGQGRPARPVLATAGLAATVLTLTRPVSPFWVALIGVVLLVLAGRRRAAELVRERAVLAWVGVLVLAGAAQAAWVLWSGALELFGTGRALTLPERASVSLSLTDERLRQMVGWFGWLDTPAPDAVHHAWAAVLLALVVLGLRRAAPLRVVLLAAVAVAVVLVPIALEVPSVNEVGFYWQGRYTLPLAAGVPVLAAVAPRRVPTSTRLHDATLAVLLAVLAAAHVASFVVTLSRYTVGVGRAIDFTDVDWQPPGSAVVLIGLFGLAAAVWSLWLLRLPVEDASHAPAAPAAAEHLPPVRV